MYYELQFRGLRVDYQRPFNAVYKGQVVREYFADLVVENAVIVELKSVNKLADLHLAQVINYLRISDCRLGLLLNFQPKKLEIRRIMV